MSSITKNWTEEAFREELRRIDRHVKETKGIELAGAELPITFSKKARCNLGMYYPMQRKFRFSLLFFNSDVPEACAIDVIHHEYAHYYADVVLGYRGGHGAPFKAACQAVGANPRTYYSREFENAAREQEQRTAQIYASSVRTGQSVIHPVFGRGTVLSIQPLHTSALLKIDFGKQGIKVVDEAWLKGSGVV